MIPLHSTGLPKTKRNLLDTMIPTFASSKLRTARLPKAAQLLALVVVAYSGAACLSPPISNDVTAQSLEKGEWRTAAGASQASVYLRQDYGVTENLDIGLMGEGGGLGSTVGARAKYTLPKKAENLEWAAIAGMGFGKADEDDLIFGGGGSTSVTGYYVYLGTIASYSWEEFEAYFIPRFNALHYSEGNVTSESSEEFDLNIGGEDQAYASMTLGGTWWVKENAGITTNVTTFVEGGEISDPFLMAGIVFSY